MAIVDVPPVSSAPLDIVDLRHKRRESALAHMVAAAERLGVVREPLLLMATLSRGERMSPSALGKGIAVPGARTLAVTQPVMILGRSARGIDWGVAGAAPVHLVLLVLTPSTQSAATHAERVLSAVHALRLQKVRQRLMDADGPGVASLLRGETH